MVVEQEMAEIYPPDPEDLCEFLPETDCAKCGFQSCMEFAAAILKKEVDAHKCSDLDSEFAELLNSTAALKMEPIPYNIMMEQAPCELIEINGPDENSPLLVTCNFRETVAIMKYILGQTGSRVFLLPTYTHGYSVDNAVHEKMFKSPRSLESNTRKQCNREGRAFSTNNPWTGGVGKEFDQTVDAVECPRGPGFRISFTALSYGKWVMDE